MAPHSGWSLGRWSPLILRFQINLSCHWKVAHILYGQNKKPRIELFYFFPIGLISKCLWRIKNTSLAECPRSSLAKTKGSRNPDIRMTYRRNVEARTTSLGLISSDLGRTEVFVPTRLSASSAANLPIAELS